MRLHVDRKVEGGKLLRVTLELEEGIVREVRVHGDFFAHPEALFDEAESGLAGLPRGELAASARLAFARPGLTIYGANADAIADTIAAALEGATDAHPLP